LDREAFQPALGEVDTEAGEFWVQNPFLMQSQGHNLSAYERNKLYLNMGGSDFINASFATRADIDSDSRSVIAADFNRDGSADLLVGSVGGGPLRLFLNRIPQGNRVRIHLQGVDSNHSAIGSRVTLYCGKRKIIRDKFCANGFMGQGPGELLVGVGSAKRIDRIIVRWPTGKSQEFHNLPIDSQLGFTEGSDEFDVKPLLTMTESK
jgi:hypothetical protein